MPDASPRLRFDEFSNELDRFLNRFNAGRSASTGGTTTSGWSTGGSRGDDYEEDDDPYSGRHSGHSGHPAPPVAPPAANLGGATPPDKLNQVVHHARRLTFGPTPQLLATIRAKGTTAWIDEQLAWQSIDESAIDGLLSAFPLATMTPAQIGAAVATGTNPMQIIGDMAGAALGRAVWGQRQLYELLVDFWSNHFSIDANVKAVRTFAPLADMQVIRANATGRFADMLLASAKSPAMLNFLDNVRSRADGTHVPNENYARELMELHTVGVDAGYTEADVKAVASLLSGWTLSASGSFVFDPRMHSLGPFATGASVLGWTPGGLTGLAAGEAFIDFLAHHPLTAARLAHKLCVRFIGDYVNPTDPIVSTVAAAYLANDTNIAPMVRTLLLSSDFANSARLKARRPFEFVAGTLREVQVAFTPAAVPALRSIATATMATLGQQLFGWPLPNGYPDSDLKWISAGGMLDRWRFAQQVATGTFPTLPIDMASLIGTPAPAKVSALINAIATHTIGENLDTITLTAVLGSLGMDGDMRWPSWNDPTPILTAILQSPQNQLR